MPVRFKKPSSSYNNYYQSLPNRELPPNYDKVVGGLNRMGLRAFSAFRAAIYEVSKATFSIPEGLFKKVNPEAKKYSDTIKIKLYNQAAKTNLGINEPLPKNAPKYLGMLNLKLIDVGSGFFAFTKVFLVKGADSFKGIVPKISNTTDRFTYETQMNVYNNLTKNKSSEREEPKIEKPSFFSKQKIEVIKIEEKATNKSKYKKTAIAIAIFGLIVLLAYYVYPLFNITEPPVLFEGMATTTWDEKTFFVKDNVPTCLLKTFTCPVEGVTQEVANKLPEAVIAKKIFQRLRDGLCHQVEKRLHPRSCIPEDMLAEYSY